MKPTFKKLIIISTVLLYSIISKLIFDAINLTSKNAVIDEAFHLPQGLQYCNYNFTTWDPKITTLPGLYLISTAIFGPLKLCTVYNLRLTNQLAAVINLILFYVAIGLFNARVPLYKKLLLSINLSLLPPLYFFSNLYYTDVLSITFILLIVIFNKKERHFLAAICGAIAIIVRQTNIILLFNVLGQYGLGEVFNVIKTSRKKELVFQDVADLFRKPKKILAIRNIPRRVWWNFLLYASVILTFVLFVYLNGGIVVGDKSAHVATIHLPQILYFSLFYLIFAAPLCVQYVPTFVSFLTNNKLFTIITTTVMGLLVHFNTQTHPYLLADNRHYTFYVWTRFYGKFTYFKYAIIPVYYYSFYAMYKKIVKRDLKFITLYIPCVFLMLIPQKLIEIRYFLIPYIMLRLHSSIESYFVLLLELGYFLLINLLTLNLFLTKDIYWNDFDYPQKLIW